jgi:hypothetical protein
VRKTFLALALVVAFALPLFAVGTVTVTTTQYAGLGNANRVRYVIAWTSTAGGAVSGNPFSVVRGKLISVKFVPNTGITQPTDLYDATLVDVDGIDLLNGAGQNLSHDLGTYVLFNPSIYLDGTSTLDLVIAAAGAAMTGTVYVWVEQ